MRQVKWIILSFMIWRLFLFIPFILAKNFIPARLGYTYANPWANFDGIHYLSIAEKGYTNDARFFPLFPLLIQAFKSPFGAFLSGFLISNLSFLLALIILHKLIRLDYSERLTKFSILFLLVFPASFFFAAVYTESLFLLFSVLAFYFMRKRKWWLASITSLLLTLTRPVGLIILPALVLEFFLKEKKIYKILPILFTPIGLIGFAWFNLKKWGDALYFFHSQGQLLNGRTVNTIVLFPQTMFRYLKILISLPKIQYEWWIALLEFLVFLLCCILLYIGWKKKLHLSYLLYSFLGIFIPASSGTFSGLPRYIIVLFPLFIALALIKNKFVRFFYVSVSVILLFLLLSFFLRGYFVA